MSGGVRCRSNRMRVSQVGQTGRRGELVAGWSGDSGEQLVPVVAAAGGRACGPGRRAPRRRAGATSGSVARRGADVTGRIGRGLAPAVDRVELLVRVAREDEVMVQQVIVATIKPEVEDDAGTGRLVAAAARSNCATPAWPREQLAMGPHGVRSWRRRPPAEIVRRRRSRLPATPPCSSRRIARTSVAGTELDAEVEGQAGSGPRHGPRPAPRIPDALAGLHVGDAAEHGRRERRAPSRRTA